MLSLMASLHARWQISVRSAPEKPLVILARKSKSTSCQTKQKKLVQKCIRPFLILRKSCSSLKCVGGHLADGTLAEIGLQDADPALLVRQWDVDELIQTARSQDGRVDDVWSVCGSNDEDVLLAGHSVHLSQDLVDDTVSCSTAISHVASTGLGYGVQLIKEQNAWGCLSSLET